MCLNLIEARAVREAPEAQGAFSGFIIIFYFILLTEVRPGFGTWGWRLGRDVGWLLGTALGWCNRG